MNEFELIDRYFKKTSVPGGVGIGDDCALIPGLPMAGDRWAISKDLLIEGQHFFADTEPRALGHKTLAVNLSDLAACGAEPRYCLLGMGLRAPQSAWLDAFAQGFSALADRFNCQLIGGDTTATTGPLILSVTVLGATPEAQALLRNGAHVGDDIWVSGELGAAAAALAHHTGQLVLDAPSLQHCNARLHQPEPRVALGVGLRHLASSAIDISDGLAQDLQHILKASQVAAVVETAHVPYAKAIQGWSSVQRQHCVLAGGDDYELCFTSAPCHQSALQSLATTIGLKLTRIGCIVPFTHDQAQLRLVDEQARCVTLQRAGYQHFASPSGEIS